MAVADKYKEYKGPEDLPGTLRPKDVAQYLGINSRRAYEIFKRDDFNSISISSKRLIVTKKNFLHWLDQQSKQ